jgi:hypothetical protein
MSQHLQVLAYGNEQSPFHIVMRHISHFAYRVTVKNQAVTGGRGASRFFFVLIHGS